MSGGLDRRWGALPLFLFVVAYLLPLGGRPLAAADEVRYAEIPREMLVHGDWVVPRLDGLRYFEKTPLGYWTNALAMSVFGETPFANRLPSALAAGLMALVVGLLAARAARDRRPGALAAAGLLACLGFHALGTLNILDALFSALVTASLAAFFMATESKVKRAERGWLALMGAVCGLAFLTKGFLAFALPVIVAAPYMLWERRFLSLFHMCWIPIGAAVLVAAPWSIAIALREPDYWRYFFFVEHLDRFTQAGNMQHEEPWYYFVPVILLGALPWTALVGVAVRAGSVDPRTTRFALCWLVVPFLFFSYSSGKLFAYVLPCIPPLVLLVSSGVWRALERGRRRGFDAVAYTFAVLFALAGIAGGVALFLDRSGEESRIPLEYGPGEWWRLSLPIAGLLFAGAAFFVAARRTATFTKLAAWSLAPLGLLLSILLVFPSGGTRKFPLPFLREALAAAPADALFVAQDRFLHAVCYALERDDVVIVGEPGELTYGLGYEDAGERHVEQPDLVTRLHDPARTRPVVVVVRDSEYESFWAAAPPPTNQARFDGVSVATFAAPD